MTENSRVRLVGAASPGVQRMIVLKENLLPIDRWGIFLSIFLLSWVYSLEGLLRYVYQPYATAGFQTHSTLATIGVLRSVIAAAAQPTVARIADVFGRLELVIVSVIFYVVGTAIDGKSHNVETYSAGSVLYQIGFTTIGFLVEVIIADITSTETRLIFSYVPLMPFLVNPWISGFVSKAVLSITDWRWGILMWAIIYSVAAIPLILALWLPLRRIKQAKLLDDIPSPLHNWRTKEMWLALSSQLDVVGIILLVAVFALILVPFTIAGGSSAQWEKPKVIVPLICGGLLLPVWIWWEHKTEYALVPFKLLTDRAVWGSLGIACMLTFCWYLQNDFLYTVLIVSFNESIKSATNITGLYSFCSVLTGTILGFVVLRVRYLKPFIFAGTLLFLPAFGLLVYFRGGVGASSHSGMIGGQILLGIAGGFIPYPTQVSIQVATKPKHLAVMTGLYLATYNLGSALGNTVSGAIWTHTLKHSLMNNLPEGFNNATTAQDIFDNPFVWAKNYPIGTPVRDGINESYRHVQKLLTVAGICLVLPMIFFSLVLRDPKLSKKQSLDTAERKRTTEQLGHVDEGNKNKWVRLWRGL
ncbi:siderophore iron transporter 1 [Cadophora sp. DSE1049]|nr:siderophore iron transporter 1 [Cadophora sp. DSE1049]